MYLLPTDSFMVLLKNNKGSIPNMVYISSNHTCIMWHDDGINNNNEFKNKKKQASECSMKWPVNVLW